MRQPQAITTYVAPTVGQQIFTIGSALAGGLTGIILAREFANVDQVPRDTVILTTLVSVVFTVGAGFYLAKKVKEV